MQREVREKMSKEICERCKKEIDTDTEMFVTLGTHQGKETTDMRYFHFNCWRTHFEEKTREKAQVIVDHMGERVMPIAKQLTSKLGDIINGLNKDNDHDGGEVITIN